MNSTMYASLIGKHFGVWLRQALGKRKAGLGGFLLQDHERALWRKGPLEAMRQAGVKLLDNFPKCSQDLNPMEIGWREIRVRLDIICPSTREYRDDFIRRLRLALIWVNKNRAGYLREICRGQKAWAMDVQTASPPGSRTKH